MSVSISLFSDHSNWNDQEIPNKIDYNYG